MVETHTENSLIALAQLRVIVKTPPHSWEQKSISTFWRYYSDAGREPRQICRAPV
jgi:hypothetical protein